MPEEAAMVDRANITIELTREQRLEILEATGLFVQVLEVPLEILEASVEALSRRPLPKWLQQLETGAGEVE
jgi:hypothetical protein